MLTVRKSNGLEVPRDIVITPESSATYWALVREVSESERGETNRTRAEILQILDAAGRRPIEFADDVDNFTRPLRRL
jgi:hypothetical protein